MNYICKPRPGHIRGAAFKYFQEFIIPLSVFPLELSGSAEAQHCARLLAVCDRTLDELRDLHDLLDELGVGVRLLALAQVHVVLHADADVEANGPFVGLGLCRTMLWDSDKEDYARSTVMVCSSLQIIGLGNSSARVGNLQAIMNTFDNLLGRSDADDVPSFDSRKFAKDQFETIPSDTAVNVMVVIFVVVLPVAVLITGVVVWIKRRRS